MTFRLPHCVGCCRAILYATRFVGGCHAVEIFDVVEARLEGGSGDPPARVIIDGLTRPLDLVVSSLYGPELTADAAEYIQVAAVLHTFKVLSSVPLNSAADRPVSLKDLGGGFVQFVPRLKSLFSFLSARHAHTVTLLFFLQWEERVTTNLERQWLLLFHCWGIGQRQLMRQPFLRVGDRHSVAGTIWMEVHRGKISALFPCLCRWNATICFFL
ncbi:leucine-rich repeat protein, putative [Trypanosoma cruzi marinkellei]|uniref:Leucine-rich repeat protein, putative n=1 Tax=Trypanosoma cruzi marinkellei TaxID=85056 RepID=K2NH61_TRYCR|nr:leucine-rich repeat protein, putative [Trypanosoma cruzi marinkellei]